MTSSLKSVFIFILGVIIAAGVLWLLKPAPDEPVAWSQMSEQEIATYLQDGSDEEVIQFMEWAKTKEWDLAKDVIPAYVANAGEIRKARAAVANEFAQFSEKDNSLLIAAVREFPLKYMDYCTDLRAIERFYIHRGDSAD